MLSLPRTATLLLLAALTFSAESFDEKLKATDLSNADAVFDLAQWCKDNGLPAKARQYYNAVIKLNRDHEGAREALGQVRVGERWLPKSQVKDDPKPKAKASEGEDEPVRRSGGKAPTAAEVTWNVPVPADPSPNNGFITLYVTRMPTVANDSRDMEVSIETILADDNVRSGVPRLIAALNKGDFKDLYGAASILPRLMKDGHKALAKALIGPLVKASLQPHEAEDLAAFADAVAVMKDKRVVPRLADLLDHANEDVQHNAAHSLTELTGLPRDGMTSARVRQWWEQNWDRSDREIFRAQLKSKDPVVSLAAARALADQKDKDAVEAAIGWMRSEDPQVAKDAFELIVRWTLRDWGWSSDLAPADKAKRVDLLAKWWKENKEKFTYPVDKSEQKAQEEAAAAGKAAPKEDPCTALVQALGATDAKAVSQAQSDLLGRGGAAVPALIKGLEDPSPIVARTCNDLLKQFSKKTDIPFNPRDPDEAKHKAVEAWQAWAQSKGFWKPAEDAAETPEE